MDSTIRVWLRGPITITDERGTRIDGDFDDVAPSESTAHSYNPAKPPPPWELSTVGKDQAIGHRVFVWIWRGDAWVEARIEPMIDTAIRSATIAEREACAVVAEKLRAPVVAQMLRARSALDP